MYGRTDCVKLLVDAGADKEAKEEVRIGRFVGIIQEGIACVAVRQDIVDFLFF